MFWKYVEKAYRSLGSKSILDKGSTVDGNRGRPIKIIGKNIKRILDFNRLNADMIYDRTL